jgi:AcrR family transcriptional regulator
MPRPRSDVKRSAILEAATRIIVTQGLSAPTAGIAKEAGVANGSPFTYFETKTDLFNQLYLEIKTEIAAATLKNRRPVRPVTRPWRRLLNYWNALAPSELCKEPQKASSPRS